MPADNAIPSGPRCRLAVVLSHPTQYYSPWFRWLAAHTALELRVFYLWDFGVTARTDPRFGTTFAWDVDLLSGYAHEFVPNRSRRPGTEHFGGLDNPELAARVAAWRPDAALVFGYRYRTHLGFLAWARRQRLPLIFRGDSHLIDQPPLGLLKRWMLAWVFRQFAAVTFVGQANRDYFRTFGVPEGKLHFAPHAVDTSLFDSTRLDHRTAAAALRTELGLAPATRVMLFAGKFHPEKQPRALLAAFLALAPRDTSLVFVGDGAEKAALIEAAQAAPPGTVHILPFANQSAMPARYLLADLFVLPSLGLYETWGLAVNEAMHLGVPCLVSHRVGCQRDLVTEGETGWVFRAGDHAHLQSQLAAALAADPAPLRSRIAGRIAGYTYASAAAGLQAAVAAVTRA